MNNLVISTPPRYREKHRPQVHFTPPENWMNDPNGMVYFEGLYHLFYQYNPSDKVWNDMHWGHATSSDLITWEHRPVALHSEPAGLGFIFSGCAVVDWNNTSGFGVDNKPPLVAIFTHSSTTADQVQSLAYSNDSGDNWTVYSGNPILGNHGIADFRDPKVFWDDRSDCWVMVLAAGPVVKFYRSADLRGWEHFHDFGEGVGAHGGVWECPDLFQLEIENSQQKKWVLIVSMNPGGPNGGSATQYFIGDFDGERFVQAHSEILWLDYGPDNYAGVTWSDMPADDGRRILIAWMSNWQYANIVPTDPWRGSMTVPRELTLIKTKHGLRLACRPISEFNSLRIAAPEVFENLDIDNAFQLHTQESPGSALDIEMKVNQSSLKSNWELRFHNRHSEELTIKFTAEDSSIEVNRQNSMLGLQAVNAAISTI
ncbi:MAG: glycoside hydrolase family 32 protein, partial [Gammaproteobacteria bacterium]|nr:glycoside hydrolase family 32 protein [Gammaproteobacteria bacterium]